MRHPETHGTQDPVERPGGDLELGARLRLGHLVDQAVDRWRLQPGKIVAAMGRCRGRAEKGAKLGARRLADAKALGQSVEIEILETLLILRIIDDADRGVDANAPQALDIGADNALEGGVVKQELDPQRFALVIAAQRAVELPAGLIEESACLLQQFAIETRAVA